MTPKQELFLMHHGLGRKIRNHYGMWQHIDLLYDALGIEHPDDASSMIIDGVWDKLRETEAEGFGFLERECKDCGADVLIHEDEDFGTGLAWCYDCERKDQVYEPWMDAGEE